MNKQELQNIRELINIKGKVVSHNDLDGVLSALYYCHVTRSKLCGMFDVGKHNEMNTIYTTNGNLKKFTYLDLSLKHTDILSIDHHFSHTEIYKNNSNCINANRYFSWSNGDAKEDFKNKMPLNCVLWLMYLLGEDLNKYDYRQQLLLVMADSVHKNYWHYKENVVKWLKALGFECLIETLESETIREDIAELKEGLGIQDKKIKRKINDDTYGFSGWVYGIYKEVDVLEHYKMDIKKRVESQEKLDIIAEFMGWNYLDIPHMYCKTEFINYERDFDYVEENLLDRETIFTMARTTLNNIAFSYYDDQYLLF